MNGERVSLPILRQKVFMNIAENLKIAAEVLQRNKIAEARREANSLLAFVLQKDKIFLIAHSEYELSDEEEKQFHNILERRAGREPFQYIVGKQEFYGLDFAVTKDVLIPRPETELLVETAIEILQRIENARFCEVGIGSGCISISILYSLKTASAIGLDISQKALTVARENAERHKVTERLELKISDVFSALTDETFDLIVSNPPYISIGEMQNLQTEVRDFEPSTALTDGANGFTIIEKIIKDSPKFLEDGGFLLMEIGYNQSIAVEKMFDANIWRGLKILPDLQGIPRTVKAEKK